MRRSNDNETSGRRGRTWGARTVLGHAALTAAVLVAALPTVLSEIPGNLWPLSAVITAGIAATLVVRGRGPLPAFATMTALAGVAILTDSVPLAIAIGMAASAYAMAAATPRRLVVIVTCAAAVVLGIANLFAADGLIDPGMLILSLITFAAAAIGDATRSRRELLHAALDRAERAEQTREAEAARQVAEERLRIARDLHDAVGHRMTIINIHAGAVAASLDEDPDEARRSLHAIGSSARSVLTEIQQLLNILRTDQPRSDGENRISLTGLDDLIADLGSAGMAVMLTRTGSTTAIAPEVDAVAFRVVQEALVNASRHGSHPAAQVTIEEREQLLTLHIVNDRTMGIPWTEGNGLRGMRERVEGVGGSLKIGPVGGRRFEVIAVLPPDGATR
jgi:signal transduction histidine kinase